MENNGNGLQLKLKIITVNVRGIRNAKKRQNIYHWLNEKQADIVVLQETYCTSDNIKDLINSGLAIYTTHFLILNTQKAFAFSLRRL